MARSPAELLRPGRPLTLAGVADGAEGLVLADLARAVAARADAPATSLLVVCRDGPRMAALARALGFFAPDIEVLEFPAWDCLPYDRVSPHAGFVAQRMTALSRLARVKGRDRPSVLLTTVNAALQRVPARDLVARQSLSVAPGNMLAMDGHHPMARAQRLRARLDRARARRLCGARRHHRSLRAGHGRAGAARFLRRHAGIDPELRSREPAHHRPAARLRPGSGRRVPAHHRNHPALPARLCRSLRRARARRPALPGGERRPPSSRHGALAAAVPRPAGDDLRLSAGLAGRARAAGGRRRARALRADQGLLRGAAAGARPARLRTALPSAAAGAALSRRGGMAGAPRAGANGPAYAVRGAGRAGAGHRCRHQAGAQLRRRARRARPQRVRGGDRARLGAAVRRQARGGRAVERRRARAHAPRARRPRPRQSLAGRVVAGGAGAAEARRSRSPCSGSRAGSRPPTRR